MQLQTHLASCKQSTNHESLLMIFRLLILVVFCCVPLKSDAQQTEYRSHKKIVYAKPGDEKLLLDAYIPSSSGKHPAILVVHGGAWKNGNRHQLRGYAEALAARGFSCFAIDYRLAPKHKFPAQIEDCRTAVQWIRDNAKKYKVDTAKIGAIGYSAGGHLVSLLATTGEAPSEKNGNVDTRLQAVVAGGAPTDFRWFPDNGKWATYLMGGDLSSAPEKFKQASSTAFVDPKDTPTFFFHGEKDSLVPLIWASRCFDAMKKEGVKTEMYKIEGVGHLQAAQDATALKKAYEFLAAELQEADSDTK